MKKKLWIAFAVVVALGVGASWISGHFRNAHNARDVAKADAQHERHEEQKKESAHIDTVTKTIYVHENALGRRADSLDVVADTLGQHAKTVRDSLDMWRGRDSVHVLELLALRAAKDSADRRALLFSVDRDKWKADAGRLDEINQSLKRDVEHANDCHIVPFVPCPTRTETLVIGGIGGALVARNNQKVVKKLFALGR